MAIVILNKPKKPKKPKKLKGTCQHCKTRVACDLKDTKYLHDRDTTPGSATRYVKCPGCGHDYLWVR